MNRSSFALLGSIVLASASVAITTSAPSSAGISPKAEQAGENPTDEQLAQSTGSQSGQSEDVQALPLVKNAVLKDASQQTGKPISELSIVDAQKQTWSDGCLGLGGAGVSCTQATIPGWKVTVASGEKRWVYRTNISGTLVKWDEAASQAMTAQGTRQSTSRLPLRPIQLPGQSSVQATPRTGQPTVRATPRTEQPTVRATPRTEQPTVRATPRTEQPQTRINSPATFSLAIRQPSGKLSDAIARISLKSKSDNSYSQERFVGDFKYKINKRAQFVGGMNAGDRVVVRLYDLQNRLLGFSEFELLPRNTAVYLILPDSPTEPPVLRTAYGSDNNQNGSFDIGRNLKVYDYFTQISDSSSDGGSVTFLGSLNTGNPSLFQVGGLPKPTSNSVYPSSFTSGSNAVVNQQMSVFSSDMAAVLTATPGKMAQLINVSANNTSTYRVNQLIAKDQQVGNSQPASVPPSAPASVSFNDVPTNYWAKGFISALAQKEIIKGYQGRFRPNDPVTRGE
nr:S-layer homology domain-containing protein [Aphanothece sp. CMT-3BRIN-NPC111]